MEKQYIDLHIHTIYSDGEKTPIEVLKMAEELKLSIIAITDHENCKAYEELEKIETSKIFNGKLISGCELMASFNNIMIEILGYNIDIKKINDWYDKKYSKCEIEKRDRKLFERLKANIKKENLKIDYEIELPEEIPYSGYFKYMIYEELKKYKYNETYFKKYEINNYEDFIRSGLSNSNNPLYIGETEYISTANEIVDLIHEAGGLAFVAHLYKYKLNNHIDFLNQLINNINIDGVECYHSSFSSKQTKELEDFCERNNLLKSGGSDYHGELKKNAKIGQVAENEKIQKEVVANWINNVI